ncbi:MAG TPA: hypothetical protein VFY59_03500 [Rubrobacter sp.]|nr:hypothetical protein [Rubrobacter sp.]
MTEKRSGSNRFGWLTDEEDPRTEEVLREEAPAAAQISAASAPASAPVDPPAGVPGVSRVTPGVTGRRRRNRAKNPKALRNDPERMMAGARIRRDVRRRVDQALADPAVSDSGQTNYSLLVEALLVRWLEEVGYPIEAG